MFKPAQFQEYLSHHGLIDDVYSAICNPDYSEAVLTIIEIFKKIKKLPAMKRELKRDSNSDEYRIGGNVAYNASRNQKALMCYNKALLWAPADSRTMKLAYSNRSALLHKTKAFSACLNDINTCFAMGCPHDILEKLRTRREDALSNVWMEKLTEAANHTPFSDEFFNFNVKRNPMIPCASLDVGVVVESQVPKVVAVTDVKVGTVLAIETAFVSQTDILNANFSCYYCHKMTLNLTPCENCWFALFCDETCKQKCLTEYHRIECQIYQVLEAIAAGSTSRLALKAALKMKNMSKSWAEFIAESYDLGVDRVKISPINEIFNSNYKFSLLSAINEKHFLTGPLYNACFTTATIIYYLEEIPSFFPPPGDERKEAIRAFGRIMVFLTLFSTHTQLILSTSVTESEKTEFHAIPNYGWFSFIGKLRNSCQANVLAVALNKKIALVALQPLKRGTELTISHVGHWLDSNTDQKARHKKMFVLYGTVCNCLICSEQHIHQNQNQLTELQKRTLRRLNLAEMRAEFNPKSVPEIFPKLCKTLAFLSDLPYSEEYCEVYTMFRKCLLYLQDINTGNVILDFNG